MPDPIVGTAGTPEQSAAPERSGPRSGYARMKFRHRKLIDDHEDLKAEYQRLAQDYRELEGAFAEMTKLNSELAADLRQQRAPLPSPLAAGLMGARYGR